MFEHSPKNPNERGKSHPKPPPVPSVLAFIESLILILRRAGGRGGGGEGGGAFAAFARKI